MPDVDRNEGMALTGSADDGREGLLAPTGAEGAAGATGDGGTTAAIEGVAAVGSSGDVPGAGVGGEGVTAETDASAAAEAAGDGSFDASLVADLHDLLALSAGQGPAPPEAPPDMPADVPSEAAPEAGGHAAGVAGGASPIAAIDAELAAGADDAVAGAFETVDDVLGEDASDVLSGAAEARAGSAAGGAGARPHDEERMEVGDDLELAGDFTSPDELLAEPAVHLRLPTEAPDVPDPDADGAEEGKGGAAGLPGLLWPVVGPLREMVWALRRPTLRALAMVNRPVELLPSEFRSAVGYAAVLTVFNAMCLLVYGLLG